MWMVTLTGPPPSRVRRGRPDGPLVRSSPRRTARGRRRGASSGSSATLPLLHGDDQVGKPRPGVLAVEIARPRRMVRVRMVVADHVAARPRAPPCGPRARSRADQVAVVAAVSCRSLPTGEHPLDHRRLAAGPADQEAAALLRIARLGVAVDRLQVAGMMSRRFISLSQSPPPRNGRTGTCPRRRRGRSMTTRARRSPEATFRAPRHVAARGDPHQQARLAGQPLDHPVGLLGRQLQRLVGERRIVDRRDDGRGHVLHPLQAVERRVRLDRDQPDPRALFPQIAADTHEGAAGAQAGDEVGDRAAGLLPDLGAGGAVVGPPVLGVRVLVEIGPALRLLGHQPPRLQDGAVAARHRIGDPQLGAVGAQDLLALGAGAVRAGRGSPGCPSPRRSWRRRSRCSRRSRRAAAGRPSNSPRRSASRTMASAGRSFTEPPGLAYSALANSLTSAAACRSAPRGRSAACCRSAPDAGTPPVRRAVVSRAVRRWRA